MSKLAGKVAIVTGASKGIGASIAKSLAGAGASVVVNYASSKEGADRVVAEIVSADGKAVAIQGDVSQSADVERLFSETKKAFGGLDVLVNNAGIYQFGPLESVTEAEFHRQFNTNVLGVFLTMREALKYFGPAGGNIINVSTVAVRSTPAMTSVYTASKGALEALSGVFAKELGPRKIRVNVLSPGGTETEGAVTAGIVGSDFANNMVSQTPLGRMGQPSDMGPIVVFLASEDAAWVTGENIIASGGMR